MPLTYSLFTLHKPHSEQLIEWHSPLARSAHASPGKGRWLSVSETGGVCTSTERCKKTPQSAHSGCQLQLCIKHLYAA